MNTKAIILGLAASLLSSNIDAKCREKIEVPSRAHLEKIVRLTKVNDAYDYAYKDLERCSKGVLDDYDLLAAKCNMHVESGSKQYRKDGSLEVSTAGAIGLGQVMPSTALDLMIKLNIYRKLGPSANPNSFKKAHIDPEAFSVISCQIGRYLDELPRKDVEKANQGDKKAAARLTETLKGMLSKGRSNIRFANSEWTRCVVAAKKVCKETGFEYNIEIPASMYNWRVSAVENAIRNYGKHWVVILCDETEIHRKKNSLFYTKLAYKSN